MLWQALYMRWQCALLTPWCGMRLPASFSSKLVYKYRCNFISTPEYQVWPIFVAPGLVGG